MGAQLPFTTNAMIKIMQIKKLIWYFIPSMIAIIITGFYKLRLRTTNCDN